MATKKTNKTSHVMNLLTNGAPTENGEHADSSADASSPQDLAAGSQEKKGDVQSHTVTPKKVTVVDEGSQNDRLSQEILNKLSEELEEEEGMENQKTDNAAVQSAEISAVQDTAPQAEEVKEAAPAQAAAEPAPQPQEPAAPAAPEADPAPSAPAEEPAPAPKEERVQLSGKTAHHSFMAKNDDSHLINGEYRFVNIMEHLMLRQDISSYMDQYNVCKCAHCMADVCALALTGLPAKYVVTKKDSLSPLISYYENRNKITILTALIKACNTVREHPHHERS